MGQKEAHPDLTDDVFCSELVVLAYEQAGIKTSFLDPDKTAPGDLEVYFNSIEGKASGWVVWDTYNIAVADASKIPTAYLNK